ncbi:MAG TPA: pyridoxine 5'-phosphate synthase [Bdellovibrionota bacterium]|nr:pyridoxine 5'-phosphate synthase [Bdellovibrionota bacterium]
MTAKLGVNIDHVATLRQARRTKYPDPVAAAVLAEMAGVDNITCHLREDRRHIQDRDVRLLRDIVQTELNLEMAATQEMLRFALDLKPDTVTLVPERREELTTEGGLNLTQQKDSFGKSVALLREAGILVSLFVDPETDAIKLAHRFGAQAIEIHTGRYANAVRAVDRKNEVARIIEAVQFAAKLKLGVHAGHGLNSSNIQAVAAIREIESFQIGHSIVAQAVLIGFDRAVREMKQLILLAS